jgi:hypothetical protein
MSAGLVADGIEAETAADGDARPQLGFGAGREIPDLAERTSARSTSISAATMSRRRPRTRNPRESWRFSVSRLPLAVVKSGSIRLRSVTPARKLARRRHGADIHVELVRSNARANHPRRRGGSSRSPAGTMPEAA